MGWGRRYLRFGAGGGVSLRLICMPSRLLYGGGVGSPSNCMRCPWKGGGLSSRPRLIPPILHPAPGLVESWLFQLLERAGGGAEGRSEIVYVFDSRYVVVAAPPQWLA